jgi:signal transduction histidine kinase
VRLRLTVLYGALFLVTGAVLLAITYELVAGSVSGDARGLVNLSIGSPTGGPLPAEQPNPTFYLTPQRTAVGSRLAPARLPLNGATSRSPGLAKLQKLARNLQTQAQIRIQQQRSDELGALLTRSGLALGLMTLVSIGLGWVMAGRALRPVRTMSARARGITERNLHERLALEGPADELKELGDTFDGLLSRLEGAFESQRRFVANASHELRTPITVQRTLVEVALGDPEAGEGSLRAACERVIAVGEQQERLIESLLTLARSQGGLKSKARLDLTQAVKETLNQVEARDVRIEATLEPAPMMGDPGLIERLVVNLVDNALHYNQADGWIRAATGVRDGRAMLEITNAGPVVRADEVEPLFEPFRRRAGERTANPGRASVRPVLGLGLSIVRAIADAHGAQLTATAGDQGGLRVQLSFPAVPAVVPGASDAFDRAEPVAGGVRLMA